MINIYTSSTPNGRKPIILLEELQLPYTVYKIDFSKKDQFTPEFIAINPNNKIPAIVDDEAGLTVFESGAILMYLAEKTKSPLLPDSTKNRYEVIQWLMFQMAGVGPMMGQFFHFSKYADEKVPYAIERYTTETNRLLAVLNTKLSAGKYIAGDYSIADIATYHWIAAIKDYIDFENYSHINSWLDTLVSRPAIQVATALFSDDFRSDFGTLA